MGGISNLNSTHNTKEKEERSDLKHNGRREIKRLPIKKFEVRDSLITVLCQNPHIKVVKHIFAAFLVGLFLNTVVHDFLNHGELRVGFKVIAAGMGKPYWVAAIWIVLHFCIMLAYYCFNLWANIRIHFPPKGQLFAKTRNVKLWDAIWLLALIAYYILQFRVISVIVSYLELPIGSSSVVCLEQTRLLMKLHAFVRSNAEKVIKYKPHSDEKLHLADLKHFMYFLFAPTIVYADHYPRTTTIRWKFVFEKTIELVGVIFYYAFLLERFIIPTHKDIGLRLYTVKELTLLIVDNFAVGLMFLLLGFYVVIDTTQNLFGELLMFGDRQFYLDWWTSTSYSEYFRTWNMVVGDWLYMYIYKDFYEHVIPGNKTVAKITVFVVSAIVHEWVITYMFGFLFPALFLTFTFVGSVLSFISIPKIDILNIFFWYGLALGSGLLTSLYAMEWFVRENLPNESASFTDFFIPKLLTCNCIVY